MKKRTAATANHILLFVLVVSIVMVLQGQKKDYNVLIVSIDTLRADRLGFMSYEKNTSPNMDKFASKSAVFSNLISQASWTLPSHMSIFSSRYPFSIIPPEQEGLGAESLQSVLRSIPIVRNLSQETPMLAEILKKEGYVTAAFVSGEFVSSEWGFDRGFDEFHEEGVGSFIANRTANNTLRTIKGMMPSILDWLEVNKDRNFFLFLHFFDVHAPYDPPAEFDVFHKVDESNVEKIRANYDGEILYTDHYLQYVFDKLEDLAIMKNTIIVITSDHGEELFEHGVNDHSPYLYQTILHVPLIIFNGKYPHKVINAQVRSIDIAPTILAMLDMSRQPTFQGSDLTPLILGLDTNSRIALSVSSPSGTEPYRGYAVVDKNKMKLFYERQNNQSFFFNVPEPEISSYMYNLYEDPNEMVNIFYPSNTEAARLKGLLTRLIKSMSANTTVQAVEGSNPGPEVIAEMKRQGYVP